MAKVRVIADNSEVKKFQGTDYWEIAQKEYEYKTIALSTLDKKILVVIEDMIKRTMQVNGNFVFSPVALYLAMISLTKITDGNSRKQIVNMLGITENDLVSVYSALKSVASSTTSTTTSDISSSLWMNDKMDYNEELLLQLNKKVHLASYVGEMGSSNMNDQIAKWINKATGNMLTDLVKIKTTKETLLELLTTIYFQSQWKYEFYKDDTIQEKFILDDNKEVRCKFMNQWIRTAYHIGTKFTAITKALYDGYDAIFILPNEGIGIDEVIHDFEWSQLATTGRLNTTKQMQVDLSMPKYDISTKLDLKNVMKLLGVEDIFDSVLADFTPISTMSEVFLTKAEQTTRFKVNEEGIEAASCVEFGVVAAGIPPRLEEVKFVLNRPFIFMVVSRHTVPVFVGKVKNPCEK